MIPLFTLSAVTSRRQTGALPMTAHCEGTGGDRAY